MPASTFNLPARKVILITGGSRGIGAAVAQLAAEQGYAVCISYLHNQVAAEAVVAAVRQKQGEVIAIQADVALEADVVRLFKQVDATFGTLTALVNNAGVLDRQARVDEMDSARLQRIFATNVIGSFICAREAVRRMSTRHGGRGGAIVNLSSSASRLGAPGEYVDYAASKAAINTLTIGLSKEVAAEGIRVNTVSPGVIYTDIHASGGEPQRVDRVKQYVPMKRGGYPDEVARAVLWLLSDDASYTTGTTLDVAGGR
jgi:NAD(P)-dependent dehydrogenase (short-subunit alcohol dehydrogenase family)